MVVDEPAETDELAETNDPPDGAQQEEERQQQAEPQEQVERQQHAESQQQAESRQQVEPQQQAERRSDDDITTDSISYIVISAASTSARIFTRKLVDDGYTEVFHPRYRPLIKSVEVLGIVDELDNMVDSFISLSKHISKARPGGIVDMTKQPSGFRRVADLKQKPQWLLDSSRDVQAGAAAIVALQTMPKEADVMQNYRMSFFDEFLDLATVAEEAKRLGTSTPSTAHTFRIAKGSISAQFTLAICLRNETMDDSKSYTNKHRWNKLLATMRFVRENRTDFMLLFATVKMRFKMRDVTMCSGDFPMKLEECFGGAFWQLGMRIEHEASGDFRGRAVLSDYNVELQGIQKPNIHEEIVNAWDDTTAFFDTPAAHCEFAKACGIGVHNQAAQLNSPWFLRQPRCCPRNPLIYDSG